MIQALKFGLRSMTRDFRAGELTVLVAALAVAVTSITSVGFFTDRVGTAIRQQASASLAADMVIRSPSEITENWLSEAQEAGLRTAERFAFPSAVVGGDEQSLGDVVAVTDGYPLRGELLIADEMFGQPYAAEGVPEPGTAWAEAGLLARLGIDAGATIQIGNKTLKVTRVLDYRPDQGMGFQSLASSVLVNLADVPAMNVIGAGSRVTYSHMFSGNPGDLEAFRASVKDRLPDTQAIRDAEDASEQVTAAIDRAQRFLNLASLVTVILAAVATAMAARRYAQRHLDSVALLKSVGATQGFIQTVMLTQLLVVTLLTAFVGTLIGWAAQFTLVGLVSPMVNFELPPAGWGASWLGLATALVVAIGFALPHLMMLKSTPPMRVLRHDMPPPRLRSSAVYGIAVLALLGLIYLLVRDLRLVLTIAVGLAAVALIAIAVGIALVRTFTRFRGAAGVAWRYGLASISRRGTESVVQIVAFGLGLMVLLLLAVVRGDLLTEWRNSIPEDAPNYFMVNIKPSDWPNIAELFAEETGEEPEFLPLIRGRINAINGTPTDEYAFPDPRGANFVRRESNLTWTPTLPESNIIQRGTWWDADYSGELQISLDDELATDMGIELGDEITFTVGGEDFTAPVTSTRTIQWDSMAPNFFLVLSPGEVSDLPQTYLSSVYVPPEQRSVLKTMVQENPGVTVLDLEVILTQVRTIIERASMAVQYVFLFTLAAGVVVLLAAVQVTRDERRFESAVLHTLGGRRRTILQGVAVEFTVLGALAGLLAAMGASVIGYVLATQLFELSFRFNPTVWVIGLLAGGIIVGITGTLATRRAVSEPPVAVLRNN